jgi:quercetin dioxygenase-like cupin family protein
MLAACQMVVAPTPQAQSSELPPGPTKIYEVRTPAKDAKGPFEVIQVVLDFAPGAWTPHHTHGGQTFNTVLEGELTLNENDTEQLFKAGEGWSDTPDQLHAAGNAGTENARLLVTFFLPAGAQLTTVHEQEGSNELPPGPTKIYEMKTQAKDVAAQFEVLQVVLDFAPGAWTPVHTHGGQTFNTVLEGELTLRENDTEQVFKAGEGWSDTPEQMHAAGNEGTENARLLVTFFLPEGAQLTTVHADMAK